MKIYVAGKLRDRDAIAETMKALRAAGHEITFDWTDLFAERPFGDHPEAAKALADKELTGILDCDAFVFLAHESGRTLHMEFGAARALATIRQTPQIFVVGDGEYSSWFFDSKVKHHDSIESVVEALAMLGTATKQTQVE